MTVTDYIPRENFNLWYSLLKQSTGRLLGKPIDGTRVYVHFQFDDIESYNTLTREYDRLTTPIVETKRGFWKKLKNRMGL